MKTTILEEKPDQAGRFATALESVQKGIGFLGVDTNILNGEVIVTWGIGAFSLGFQQG